MTHVDDATPGGRQRSVLETYRFLRLATALLVLMLAVAVLHQAASAECWQTSVSAYYWTSAHSVFVGSLCAIGAGLVIYEGSTRTEDVFLDFAGFLAFVVAMVPAAREPLCGGLGLPAGYEVTAGIRNNVLAVLVAGVVAEALSVLITRRANPGRPLRQLVSPIRVGGWVVLGAGALAFVVYPRQFDAYGHYIAAVALFVAVIVVVCLNAYWAWQASHRTFYASAYVAVAASMLVSLVVTALLVVTQDRFEHGVLVVEGLLVLEFAAFWVLQTVELWHVVDRRPLIARRRGELAGA